VSPQERAASWRLAAEMLREACAWAVLEADATEDWEHINELAYIRSVVVPRLGREAEKIEQRMEKSKP
jgi:hypothetical protein